MTWTNPQSEAIKSRNQNLLLAAAAGSGKTAVLVERIIQRLSESGQPLDITEILVVTFTKAAAGEMRERIGAALTKKLEEDDGALADEVRTHVEQQLALLPAASISTFHAFCQHVLRTYFYTIDLDPRFTVAGTEELEILRQTVLEDLFLAWYEDKEKAAVITRLTDIFGNDRGDDRLMDLIVQIYDYSRSQPWPTEWLHQATAQYDLPETAELDALPWGKPIVTAVKARLSRCVSLYDEIMTEVVKTADTAGYGEFFEAERNLFRAGAGTDTWSGLRLLLSDLKFKRLPSSKNFDAAAKEIWESVRGRRDKAKNIFSAVNNEYFSVSPSAWLSGIREAAPVMKALVDLAEAFYKAYNEAKKEKNWLDFGDLEHLCLRVLTAPRSEGEAVGPSPAARELQKTYKEILIDEYQDTNGVQELIIELISNGCNKFMVGDIKQSIYRFRLADPTLFLEKYKTYSSHAGAADRRIDLATNFRSTPAVITATNEVFAYAMTESAAGMSYGDNEKLYLGRADEEAGSVELHLIDNAAADGEEEDDAVELDNFERQAHVIADRISELTAEVPGLHYRDIVILLRAASQKADVLLRVLRTAGIPAFAEEKGGYFDVMEVQLITALLACIDNPCQDIPLAAVLRSPMVGLDEAALAEIRLTCDGWLWDCLPAYTKASVPDTHADKITRFLKQMDAWRTYSRRAGVADLLQRIYDDTAYLDYVGAMKNGPARQANLEALYERARQYEEAGFRGLFRFLKFIEKMKKSGVDLAPAQLLGEGENVVRIMTIHKSKGLEFPIVFLANTEKKFNKKDMQAPVLFHKDLGIGIKSFDPKWRITWPTLIYNGIKEQTLQENRAEEERLLYVAMTRAKSRLVVVGSMKRKRGGTVKSVADFLAPWRHTPRPETGDSYLDWIMPPVLAQAGSLMLDTRIPTEKTEFLQLGIWNVALRSVVTDKDVSSVITEADRRLFAVQAGIPTGTPIPGWLDRILSWQYAYKAATRTTAKLSVSEIKRRLYEDETAAAESKRLIQETGDGDDPFAYTPAWLAETGQVRSGIFAGTVYHKALQYLDVHAAEVGRQVTHWLSDGIFTDEEKEVLNIADLTVFSKSDLAGRIAASAEVYREYPFSVLLDSEIAMPATKGEKILVQGVIDCLFKEDGKWVIVDYKTDRLEEEAAFRKRYTVQLSLYKRAVEQISGIEVKEALIYSSRLYKTISI